MKIIRIAILVSIVTAVFVAFVLPYIPAFAGTKELQMDPMRGRQLFVSKGCISCHSINGVGGHGGATNLDANTLDPIMNPFDFAAKMWSAAPAMILAQEEELEDGQIQLTGDELADIIAFVHSEEAQHGFGRGDITPEAHEMMHDAEHD